jgi:hypothetical protein
MMMAKCFASSASRKRKANPMSLEEYRSAWLQKREIEVVESWHRWAFYGCLIILLAAGVLVAVAEILK